MKDRNAAVNIPPFPPKYRASGVLLHVTSLPSRYGIGDLGPGSFAWVDRLHEAGQTWWQALPLGPTGYGNSPYSCLSSFAGNGFRATAGGNRWRLLPVLVAGQPIDRLLCRRRSQSHRHGGWFTQEAGIGACGVRRHMEPGRRNPVPAGSGLSDFSRVRRRGEAGGAARCPTRPAAANAGSAARVPVRDRGGRMRPRPKGFRLRRRRAATG